MDPVIKHPAAGAERERDEKGGRRAVDTELIRAGDEGAPACIFPTRPQPPPPCTYCKPLQVDKATRELSLPLTWPW